MKTVEERIESISREAKQSGPAIAYIKVGVQDARMLVYLAEEHGQLAVENARLRKALEFYAEESNHKTYKREAGAFHSKVTDDCGHIAKEALKQSQL